MEHTIKINRAARLSPYCPSASAEIMDSIPQQLIERLTACELADVRRALNAHWHKAIAHAERSIVSERCVWDVRRQRMIDLEVR